MLRSAWSVVFNCFEKLEKVYFLFIALKRMETFGRRCCHAFAFGVKSLSYKTKAEALQQGFAPYSSRGGFRFLSIVITQMNTDSCFTLLSAKSAETN